MANVVLIQNFHLTNFYTISAHGSFIIIANGWRSIRLTNVWTHTNNSDDLINSSIIFSAIIYRYCSFHRKNVTSGVQ